MRVKRLLLLLFPLVLLVALPGAAHANVASAFCSDAGTGYCANRAGGGTANGTHVIAYNHDLENNNDFSVYGVTYCNGSGTVTATCPLVPAVFVARSSALMSNSNGPVIQLLPDQCTDRASFVPWR